MIHIIYISYFQIMPNLTIYLYLSFYLLDQFLTIVINLTITFHNRTLFILRFLLFYYLKLDYLNY